MNVTVAALHLVDLDKNNKLEEHKIGIWVQDRGYTRCESQNIEQQGLVVRSKIISSWIIKKGVHAAHILHKAGD